MEEDEGKKDSDISEFNESLLKIGRLNRHWDSVALFREKGEFNKLKWKLVSIEQELDFSAKKLDKKSKDNNYIQQLKNINDAIDKLNISKSSKETYNNLQELYKTLQEKEKLLREIQEVVGMGAKYKDISEDEWD